MIVPLRDAVVDTSGGKASALGTLLRAGLSVPEGFVIPFEAYRSATHDLHLGWSTVARGVLDEIIPISEFLRDAIMRELEALGNPSVAVRSSAASEDTTDMSAAGQHESVLAVRGVDGVVDAVRTCWASLHSPRAIDYRAAFDQGQSPARSAMAVLVQPMVDAEVSGVMFTPAESDDATEIEASWGLGTSVVGGTVTPDAYQITRGGTVTQIISDKRSRMDRNGTRLVTRTVSSADRSRATLDETTVTRLADLGREVGSILGESQDIEWAMTGDRIWLLQARPITATLPGRPAGIAPVGTQVDSTATLTGTPGSRGSVTGTARIVRGPDDFTRVNPDDILICPHTDPAWTPLLRIAAGVVTETGGMLSHAAIVARELHIPAVLGLTDATTRLRDGSHITIDGTTGAVTIA